MLNCNHIYKKIKKSNKGMSALLVVVVIGAASIIMAKGAAFLSIGELDMGQTISEGGNAYYQAEACLDDALLRIKRDNTFLASDLELTINDNSCIINITGTDTEKNIRVTGDLGNYQKNIEANISIVSGNIFLESIE